MGRYGHVLRSDDRRGPANKLSQASGKGRDTCSIRDPDVARAIDGKGRWIDNAAAGIAGRARDNGSGASVQLNQVFAGTDVLSVIRKPNIADPSIARPLGISDPPAV
jgi:hypothetical protein